MLSLFKPKQQSILGIDISSTSVKMIELTTNGEAHRVEAYGVQLLPENTMEGVIIKDMEAVSRAVKQLRATAPFKSHNAAIAVPDSSAISKVIQLNEGLSTSEIEELVILEADKYIPFPIDEINFDFSILGPSSKNSAMVDVLIVASRSVNVSNRVDAVQEAGLEVKIVDVEAYAIERAFPLLKAGLPGGGENKVVAMIDVGASFTHLSVMRHFKTIYSREEEFGGKQLVDSVSQQYSLNTVDALQAIELGTLPDDFSSRVLAPFNEMIFLQIKRTLQYFFSTSQYNFVDHIVLAGGVSKQPGIAALVQDYLGVPTTVANPVSAMSVANELDKERLTLAAPTLMVACGLALRRLE